MELLRTAPLPVPPPPPQKKNHNNRHILRWYKWDLLLFCQQTPLWLAAIGTLTKRLTHKICLRNF